MLPFLSGCNNAQSPQNCSNFREMEDPEMDISNWIEVKPGLHAIVGSIDKKYKKSAPPENSGIKTIELTSWKAEKISAQLVLWSSDTVPQVHCQFSEFKSGNSVLPAEIAQARFVRYVMTDIFEPGCGYRKPEDFPASLSPDMLDNLECFSMETNSVRPVWLTFTIPADANPGIYKGKIHIYSKNKKQHSFDIELTVQDKVLPPPTQWPYHLDLWQHPAAIARIENVPVWSDEHFELMKPYMKMLADAGQKVITATLNKDPWNQQTYDLYEDMIIWTKNSDGSWSYDYTIFDRWIEMMMDLGITKMINCYSMIPWNNELHYHDQASGEVITVQASPGSGVFEEMWTPFLIDFNKHLKEKGWQEITNIAMDERSPEVMDITVGIIRELVPELGISFADNHKSYKRYPDIKDISVGVNATVEEEDFNYRREHGLITTYYVCCSDKFPNMFTCSDPADATYSAWYAIAAGYDGMLRWAVNSWVENPLTDSRFRTWPAGDTYMIYPEARSSIRYERLLEGLQDVEKIRILKEELSAENTTKSRESLFLLNNELQRFNTLNPDKDPGQMLQEAKKMLHSLSEK